MTTFRTQFSLVLLSALLFAACASKPPTMETLAPTSDPAAEVRATQNLLQGAKEQRLDILSPENYAKAQKSLESAEKGLAKGKNAKDILEDVAYSRGWIKAAETTAESTKISLAPIAEARANAIKADVPVVFAKDFNDLDEKAMKLAKKAEKGDTKQVAEKSPKLIKDYQDLEVSAVKKTYLTEAQKNIALAEKAGAEKSAPKTYGVALAKYQSADAMISANPRNTTEIARASNEATIYSKFLMDVTQKTKQGNTEDLVLRSEKQRMELAGLALGLAATETALIQKNALLESANEIRSKLNPNEAEVFVEGNAVKVRLKGLQFATNSSKINNKGTALLNKVDSALQSAGVAKVRVEGYTDSTGSAQANKTVSEERAKSVQNYLVQKGQLPSDAVEAVGLGAENPISNNTTAKGRAQNRRIDLVVEPKIE